MDKTKILGGLAIGLATILCVGIASAAVRIADKPQDESSSSIDTPIEPEKDLLTPTWEYLNFKAVNSDGGYVTSYEAELSSLAMQKADFDKKADLVVVPGEVEGFRGQKFKVSKFSIPTDDRFGGGTFMHECIDKIYLGDGVGRYTPNTNFSLSMLRIPDDCVVEDICNWSILREFRLPHGLSTNGSTLQTDGYDRFLVEELVISDAFDDADESYWDNKLSGSDFLTTDITIYCTPKTEKYARSLFEKRDSKITLKPLSEAPEYLK